MRGDAERCQGRSGHMFLRCGQGAPAKAAFAQPFQGRRVGWNAVYCVLVFHGRRPGAVLVQVAVQFAVILEAQPPVDRVTHVRGLQNAAAVTAPARLPQRPASASRTSEFPPTGTKFAQHPACLSRVLGGAPPVPCKGTQGRKGQMFTFMKHVYPTGDPHRGRRHIPHFNLRLPGGEATCRDGPYARPRGFTLRRWG
jgi:hypothetical protein